MRALGFRSISPNSAKVLSRRRKNLLCNGPVRRFLARYGFQVSLTLTRNGGTFAGGSLPSFIRQTSGYLKINVLRAFTCFHETHLERLFDILICTVSNGNEVRERILYRSLLFSHVESSTG